MTAASPGRVRPEDPRALERLLLELLACEREQVELAFVRRADALERIGDAIRRLGEVAVTEGILARAAAELGAAGEFHRVLISETADGRLRPLTIWSAEDPDAAARALAGLGQETIALAYPLLEREVARGSGARVVSVAGAGARTPAALARAMGWSAYAVAALTIGGETIGLLHADRTGGRPLDALDAEVAGRYAEGLAGVFERAVLRHTLELHEAELAAAVHWLSARLTGLSAPRQPAGSPGSLRSPGPGAAGAADTRLLDALTPRELEVLRLLARGQTNLAIANALVVREGTVKYHVKNILRKLGATSRADAVSRFVRAGGGPQ